MKKRVLSLLLVILMLFGMAPLSAAAYADGEKPRLVTVKFDSAGGSPVEKQKIPAGEKAKEPDDPTREGYTFLGWYTKKDKAFDFDTPVTRNLKLTAKWEENAAPVEVTAPTENAAPVEVTAPTENAAPAEDPAPAENTVSADGTTPTVESADGEETRSLAEPVEVSAQEPTEGQADEPAAEPVEEPVAEPQATEYPLWVAGVRVTSAVTSGAGWSYDGDASGGTLTLNGATITDYYTLNTPNGPISASILIPENSRFALTIVLQGNSTLRGAEHGIWSMSDNVSLTIKGPGSLDAKGTKIGIYVIRETGSGNAQTEITNGAKVYATGGTTGLTATRLSIQNSEVRAEGTGTGILCSGINVQNSKVTAVATNMCGIECLGASDTNTFSGASYVEAKGGDGAIRCNSQPQLKDGLSVVQPEGGDFAQASNGRYQIYQADGKKATHAVIGIAQTVTLQVSPTDGGTVSGGGVFAKGQTITVTATANQGYTFLNWTENGTVVSTSAEYSFVVSRDHTLTAIFQAPSFTVTFQNDDGTQLQSSSVEQGQTPSYTGETPTKASTAQYDFIFKGWKDEDGTEYGKDETLPAAQGDATYIAIYTETLRRYTIRFVNEDGTQLQSIEVEYGQTPVYSGATPTKESDAQYDYSFKGWTPELVPVTGEATYTATYDKTPRKYAIKFVNEDGTELQNTEVEYGQTPVYSGATPTKESDAQYDYSFKGWTPELVPVTGEATYKATYEATLRKYAIKFVNEDGTELQNTEVEYGQTPSYSGEAPVKEQDADYTYTFKGWKDQGGTEYAAGEALPAVKGEATYTAVYEATLRIFTVTVTDDGNGAGEATPAEGARGTEVTLTATPKEGYQFKEWQVISGGVTVTNNKFTIGTADVEVKAVFEKIEYTVTSADKTWTKGSTATVSATVERSPAPESCFGHFRGVEIDGKALKTSDYTAVSGSTVVTIKAAALQKLSAGKHTVTIVFDDGTAQYTLTVKAGSSGPRTGDTDSGPWLALMICAALGLCGVGAALIRNRRRESEAE